MHHSSLVAMQRFVDGWMGPRRGRPTAVLDVGSQDVNGTYRPLFDDPQWSYVGVDAELGAGVDLVLPGPYDWRAVSSASVDVVISGQAFEHIEFPWVTVLEVARVLRPGGLFCMLVPSSGHEHRYPVDCWRYYPDGVTALARWADLDVLYAGTDWEPRQVYDDDSAKWADTMLVAQRPESTRHAAATRLKQMVLRRVLGVQAARRSSLTLSVTQDPGPRAAVSR